MGRFERHVTCVLISSLLVASMCVGSVTPLFDQRAAATQLCCERVDTKWTYLRVWSDWCHTETQEAERSRGGRQLMNTVMRGASDAVTVQITAATQRRLGAQPCTPDGQLEPELVELLVKHDWCRGLPTVHDAIVHSPFSALADEHPTAEDELVDLLLTLCTRRWQHASQQELDRVGLSLTSASTSREAQKFLCGVACGFEDDYARFHLM